MKLFIHERDDVSYIALEGRLDVDGVAEMEEPFTDAVLGRGLPTVVDMSGISFMSSLGIGMLFNATKRLKKAGHKLVLLNPQGMVETVLKTSKMDKLMPLVYDLDEAVRQIGGVTARSAAPTATDEEESAPVATAKRTGTPEIVKLSIKNDLTELAGLYASANELLVRHGVPYRSGYAMNLAIEELVVNVIRYAFVDNHEHTIDIGLGVVDEQLILEIRDDGRPFDPRQAPPHDPDDEDLEAGGLGLILVLDLVDSLSYRRENDKNHVRVCVRIHPEEGELWHAPANEAGAAS